MTGKIQHILSPDEKLVWSGRPVQGLHLIRSDIKYILLGLLLITLAFYMASQRIEDLLQDPLSDKAFTIYAFCIPAIYVSWYMIIGLDLADTIKRTRTEYAITNKRAIILVNAPVREIHYISRAQIKKIDIVENADGSGSIIFRNPLPGAQAFEDAGDTQEAAFEYIDNVRMVYEYVRKRPRF